eukprot:971599-Rhodomonas_salina.1
MTCGIDVTVRSAVWVDFRADFGHGAERCLGRFPARLGLISVLISVRLACDTVARRVGSTCGINVTVLSAAWVDFCADFGQTRVWQRDTMRGINVTVRSAVWVDFRADFGQTRAWQRDTMRGIDVTVRSAVWVDFRADFGQTSV